MQKLLLSALLLSAACLLPAQPAAAQPFGPTSEPAAAQAAAPLPSAWCRVQALPANTALHVKARTHNAHCRLQTVDADTLACALGGNKTETYQRADILSIKVPQRTRSTVVGLVAGAGVGAIIGAASGSSTAILGRGAFAAIFAVPLGLLGAIIGAATDFTSTTIYRA